MINCLRAEFKAFFKWGAIRYTVVFLLLLSVMIATMNVLNEEPAFSGLFTFPAVVLMITSAISGLFIYQDYSQNTIRNKIAVGHSRLEVYLSKVITVGVLQIFIIALFLGISSAIGAICLDTDYVVWEAYWKNWGIVLSSTIVVATMTSLIAINIKSPVGGLLPMMFTSSTLFVGIFGMEILSLNGKEDMVDFLNSCPIICLLSVSETVVPTNMIATLLVGMGISAVFVVGGYFLFRKSDLK